MSQLLRSIVLAGLGIAGLGLAGLLAAPTPVWAAQAGWRPITVPAAASAAAPIPVNLYYPTQAPGAQALVSAASRCPGGSGQPWKAVAIVLFAVLVAAVAVPAFRARRAG